MELLSTVPKADKSDITQIGAPMPGDVIAVKVKVGDQIEKGQAVAIISAMKMEMLVKAETDGKVKNVLINSGDKVGIDDLMVSID